MFFKINSKLKNIKEALDINNKIMNNIAESNRKMENSFKNDINWLKNEIELLHKYLGVKKETIEREETVRLVKKDTK